MLSIAEVHLPLKKVKFFKQEILNKQARVV